MKRVLVLILITFVLAGCSANNSRKTNISDKTAASTTIINSTIGKTAIGRTKEIQITDTGMSLQIPNTWNPNKYKLYKEKNAIQFDYIEGSKTIPFCYITTYGKKGQDLPKVGTRMVVLTVDDWGFVVAYAHGSANAPTDYNNMAKDVQEIVSSLKIIDKSKLEQWYKENIADNTVSQQAINMLIINERSNGQESIFYIGMSIKDVKNSLNNLGIKGTGEIEITSTPEAPNYGNKFIAAGRFNFEFDRNVKLYEISILDNTPTSLGLKNGDTKEQMEKLYGKSYKVSQSHNSTGYEYKLGNKIFEVLIEKGIIVQWRVSDKETKILYEKPATCISSKDLIGLWHASPGVSAGYSEIYSFMYSNQYRFIPAEGDNSKKEESGIWFIQNGKLNMNFNSNKKVLDIGLLEDATENAAYKYKVKIDGKYFWKISNEPELSIINKNENKQNPKYTIEDVKKAFEGQKNGFTYNYNGLNKETQRYMVSTDAYGHAAVYRYEVDLATGVVYNEKNQAWDNLGNMLKGEQKTN